MPHVLQKGAAVDVNIANFARFNVNVNCAVVSANWINKLRTGTLMQPCICANADMHVHVLYVCVQARVFVHTGNCVCASVCTHIFLCMHANCLGACAQVCACMRACACACQTCECACICAGSGMCSFVCRIYPCACMYICSVVCACQLNCIW